MEQLVSRIRRNGHMQTLSDTLLLALLSNSDPFPDRVSIGVILFQQHEVLTYWYLILSGEVELYLLGSRYINDLSDDEQNFTNFHNAQHFSSSSLSASRRRKHHPQLPQKDRFLAKLSPGTLFGELNLFQHSCSARVSKPSEFIRISQEHFLNIYSRHGDHLHPYICVMEDIVDERSNTPVGSSSRPTALIPTQTNNHQRYGDPFEFPNMQNELSSINVMEPEPENGYEWNTPANLFELTNTMTLETRINEAGLIIKRTMQLRAPGLVRDRQAQRMVCR
jgi:CRP-like cAMP-binding protein